MIEMCEMLDWYISEAKRNLIERYESMNLHYIPTHVNDFDKFVLVKVTKPIRTKLGKAFDKGEFTIASPRTVSSKEWDSEGEERMYNEVWSNKNTCMSLVSVKDIILFVS